MCHAGLCIPQYDISRRRPADRSSNVDICGEPSNTTTMINIFTRVGFSTFFVFARRHSKALFYILQVQNEPSGIYCSSRNTISSTCGMAFWLISDSPVSTCTSDRSHPPAIYFSCWTPQYNLSIEMLRKQCLIPIVILAGNIPGVGLGHIKPAHVHASNPGP
jgi:hypothetical protein